MDEIEYYKATDPNGRDFRTGTIRYADALASGETIRHLFTGKMVLNHAETYLSISVDPTHTLVGGEYPCRLFRVEPEGPVLSGLYASKRKRAVKALRVVEELSAWRVFGSEGRAVVAVLEQAEAASTRLDRPRLFSQNHLPARTLEQLSDAVTAHGFIHADTALYGFVCDFSPHYHYPYRVAMAYMVRPHIDADTFNAITEKWHKQVGEPVVSDEV